MKMAYRGSHGSVDVPGLGLFGVKRGEPIEIDDSHARGQLRKQGWEYVHDDNENDDNDKEGDGN